LITGGAGSIGKEITRQIAKSNPKEIVVLDHSELNIYRTNKDLKDYNIKLILGDIKDENLVNSLIEKYKIDYIYHAAAYKHVKFLEENIHSAVKNNIIGTYNLIKAVKGRKIKFIFISTDKAVNPKNILGITKRIGEQLTQIVFSKNDYKNAKFFILRFGNVIGSDGSALPLFLNQIKNDQTISLTNKNMSRYFMSIKEACNLVLQSSVSKYKNKTFFLDMGKPIKILNIIKKMFKVYAKKDQKLKIEIIGNKFNEKISEKLFYKHKVNRTSIKKVFTVRDQISNKEKFLNDLQKIISKINLLNDHNLKTSLNNLLKIK
jgi:FlaA1/EpsC-like NDP-sugar epimerase